MAKRSNTLLSSNFGITTDIILKLLQIYHKIKQKNMLTLLSTHIFSVRKAIYKIEEVKKSICRFQQTRKGTSLIW